MKRIIFLCFLNALFICELTRHSSDVLKREGKIFIEAHRGVSNGQKNHNSKEAILTSIKSGIEAFETDAWLTKDKQVILSHDDHIRIDRDVFLFRDYDWSKLKNLVTIEGYHIPLLEDIMDITKDKIFMNLELKDNNVDEMWEKIIELIEKYNYYEQISISAFNYKYYQKVQEYNKEKNRTIVFGFLTFADINFDYEKPNHQISVYEPFLTDTIVKNAHDNGMTVGVWFLLEPDNRNYYKLFEMGVDVIITDYPMRVAEQLELYQNGENYLEGCESIKKRDNKLSTCELCKTGYQKVKIIEQDRNLCKIKYELDPDIYIKDYFGAYTEKNIVAIKMLYDPIYNKTVCKKNGNTIFYFEWLFDLYDNDNNKCIFSKEYGYTQITEKNIKKLNFSLIEIYADDTLIDSNNLICTDLYETKYYSVYIVMGAHCYFIYNGEKENKNYYSFEFKLFNNGLSYVTYDNKFLQNKDSWRQSETMSFYIDSECEIKKDPFKDRISCIDKINNCMYCKNENICEKCNYGFTLFNEQCFLSNDYQNNVKFYSPDNGTSYYTCTSKMKNCEECSYDDFSFNKFKCSKCSNEYKLSESYECIYESSKDNNKEQLEQNSGSDLSKKFIVSLNSFSMILFLLLYILF